MNARVKKLNPHANTTAAVKMNEINPKYENTREIHRLLTNQNPGLLYKVYIYMYYETTPLHRGRQPPGCQWRV
jgi:hypothetical protein